MKGGTVEKAWRIAEFDWARAGELAKAIQTDRLVAHLLLHRGVTSPENAEAFLNPSAARLSDPYAMTDMDKAVARITQARDRNESVLVYGDYDVDGVSGAAVMASGLKQFGIQRLDVEAPHRDLGYGINPSAVDGAKQAGVDLIVTVDNGVSAHDAAARAAEFGVDMVITDHHTLDDTLPQACAVINPHREDPDYPGKNLSGAAVAFKLCQALNDNLDGIDLAALGSVADLMPLQGENRSIVAIGLQQMRDRPRLGLMELAHVSRINLEQLTSENIAFQLGPRINAAGRMDDPRIALELLLTEDPEVAREHARTLDAANQERRTIELEIFEDAMAELDAWFTPERRAIVLARRGWKQGVIGIVAARVQRAFHRPTVMIAIGEDGVGRGSARSIPGCDVAMALAECTDYLVQHGGHGAAGGMTIEEARLNEFTAAFEAACAAQLGDTIPVPEIEIDAIISLSEIDMQLIKSLDALRPYGQGNRSPIFCTHGAELMPNSVRELRGGHLKFAVKEGPRIFDCIGFGMGALKADLDFAKRVDIAFAPAINEYNGTVSIQLELKDVRTL